MQNNSKMNKFEFLKLMNFPGEWEEWGMYPDDLFAGQRAMYKKGDERGAEHDRNGAFHWWLKKELTNTQINKLKMLAKLEPDRWVAAYVLSCIAEYEARRGKVAR